MQNSHEHIISFEKYYFSLEIMTGVLKRKSKWRELSQWRLEGTSRYYSSRKKSWFFLKDKTIQRIEIDKREMRTKHIRLPYWWLEWETKEGGVSSGLLIFWTGQIIISLTSLKAQMLSSLTGTWDIWITVGSQEMREIDEPRGVRLWACLYVQR